MRSRAKGSRSSSAHSDLLRQVISLAKRLEVLISAGRSKRPIVLVGFSTLIRCRRLAEAILRLGHAYSYEAKILMRSMLEIRINHFWIRLSRPNQRAARFVKFIPLEKLSLLNKLMPSVPAAMRRTLRATWTKRRSAVRHLFRSRNKKGQMIWARSWAKVESVEARLREVVASESPGDPDMFLYALYSEFSGTAHGSPASMDEVVEIRDSKLVARAIPAGERREGHYFGAALLLLSMIEAVAGDARFKKAIRPEMTKLRLLVDAYHQRMRANGAA